MRHVRHAIGCGALSLILACGSGESGAFAEGEMSGSDEAAAAFAAGVEAFDRRAGRDDAEAAVEAFERAVELAPNHAAAWAGLAQARMWLQFNQGVPGQLGPAQDALAQAEALAPEALETHVARGYIDYWGLNDYEAALEDFTAAAELAPDDADVAGAIGNVHRRMGELDEAVEYYERRVELEPDMELGLVTLAQTYNVMGQYDEVAEIADQLAELGDPRGPVWAFWAHLNAGDTAAAFPLAAQMRSEGEGPGYFDLIVPILRGDDDAALAIADSIGTDVGGGLRYEIAHLLARTDRADEHADAFEAWIADRASALEREHASEARTTFIESQRRSQLAWLEALRGHEAEAREHAARVLELQPQLRDEWAGAGHRANVAVTFALLGDNQAALDILAALNDEGMGVQSGWLEHHPSFDPLRGEPRFYEIVDARREVEEGPG